MAGGSPLVLAQQLTHIELERLGMIGPEEFVQAFVKEKAGDKVCGDLCVICGFQTLVLWVDQWL